MIIRKLALDRRTVLRGLGASLALPLLDGMIPALTAQNRTAAQSINRLGIVYLPNGIRMEHWTPAAEGSGFELTPILEPLRAHRGRLTVISGLTQNNGAQSTGFHARASTKFLTGVVPKFTQGSEVEAGVSMDQIAARELGQHTQLASLELALESGESGAGSCDVGFSCTYTSTISWSAAGTPLPMEYNPRAVFERLFGDTTTTDSAARLARIRDNRSVLDSVTEKIARLQRRFGPGDSAKLDQYLEAIRDVERRIQKSEEQSSRELPLLEQPVGVPVSFMDHAQLMYDLQVLAYQSDLTRVITFMIGREFSGRSYPEVGAPDAHHPTSHHQNDRTKLAQLTKINTYHALLFSEFLDKLASTKEGDGTLLDHSMIVYGAGMSDGNAHSNRNLPILLAGGGAGRLEGGRHLRYAEDTPLSNLHITLLDKLGVRVDRIGDSSNAIKELAGV
jgi:hypothetical protein